MRHASGQAMVILVFQTPFFYFGYLAGLILDAIRYGYFVGSTYWED
jgi:hypothetical protein